MRLCPICDSEANSDHHIKPRSQGGSDESYNKLWLCKNCHNEAEEIELNPYKILQLRLAKLGSKETAQERYWYLHRDDGVMFIGIKLLNAPVIHYDILFPYDSQIELPITVEKPCNQNLAPFNPDKPPRKGKNKKIITAELLPILLADDLTLQEKADKLKVSKSTVYKFIKETKAIYSA